MKQYILTLAALAALSDFCSAAAIGISIDSGGKSLQNEVGTPLSGGVAGVNRDGTQVVLGYFADASAANPFGVSGNFTALTGPGTPAWGAGNAVNNFTIGDDAVNGAGNGEIFKDTFAINTGVADSILPTPGTPLILRFFNANGTRLLDLANANLWTWKLPATPASSLNINLDDSGLVRRGTGSLADPIDIRSSVSATGSSFRTATAVPEPSVVLLSAIGGLTFLSRRRTK